MKRLALAILAFTSLTACGASAIPSPSSSADASPVAQVAGLDCEPIDLRTPSGERIDLTGTWTGGNTLHEVRQFEDCVWWIGLSNWPDDPPGSAWAFVFSGRLKPDFTLTGEWAQIYTAEFFGPFQGVVVFDLEFEADGGVESVILRRENTRQVEDQFDDYVADTLRRVEDPE